MTIFTFGPGFLISRYPRLKLAAPGGVGWSWVDLDPPSLVTLRHQQVRALRCQHIGPTLSLFDAPW
ncbi:hypothetical protein TMatcc_001609 [Talaromyces marneffei ATCC 18224]